MRAILFVMSEAGVPDVPSFETLRRHQKLLRAQVAVPTRRHVSSHGNIFYVNDISEQIAKVRVPSSDSLIPADTNFQRTLPIPSFGLSFTCTRNGLRMELSVKSGKQRNGIGN